MNNPLHSDEAALGWFVRTNDPEFDAWDEFTAWLEADPANAAAYHRIADTDAVMAPLLAAPVPSARPGKRALPRYVIGSGLAAAAAAALAVVVTPSLAPVQYQTRTGEVRTILLGERDQLVMNGGTTVTLKGWRRHIVELEQGQVLVKLLGTGPSKVTVVSGDLKLIDIGTIFEVARDGKATRVLVSEGAVLADPGGARLEIAAGERLDTRDGATLLRASDGDPSSVGAFQHGQLSYVDEPVLHVLADLRRSTGLDISAAEAIKARRFTGTLSVAQVNRDPRSLGPLLGVSVERSGKGWELTEGA